MKDNPRCSVLTALGMGDSKISAMKTKEQKCVWQLNGSVQSMLAVFPVGVQDTWTTVRHVRRSSGRARVRWKLSPVAVLSA